MVVATLSMTAASAYVDGFTLGVVSTLFLAIVSFMPWKFKIHGDTPFELALLSGYFKPILIGLTVVVALNALGSSSDAWNATSSVLLVCTAMLPLRRKLAAN